MNLKNEYAAKIIEKVGSKKILEIIYSEKLSPSFFSKNKYIITLMILSSFGLLDAHNIILNEHLNGINHFIHIVGVFVFCLPIFLVPFMSIIFLKEFSESLKKQKGFLKSLKYVYYTFKEKLFIGSKSVEYEDLSHELFLEISKHFDEKEMLKIVNFKLENKDLFVYSMSLYNDEKYKAFQIEQIEDNVNVIKKITKEYYLNKSKIVEENEINTEFAKSLYLKK